MYPTDGRELSNPSSAQVSLEESEELKSQRRAVVIILVRGLLLVIGVGGVNRIATATESWHYPVGAVCVLIGISQLVIIFRNRLRRIVGAHRMARGLCPTCKYELILTTGRCPECGNDPFDW